MLEITSQEDRVDVANNLLSHGAIELCFIFRLAVAKSDLVICPPIPSSRSSHHQRQTETCVFGSRHRLSEFLIRDTSQKLLSVSNDVSEDMLCCLKVLWLRPHIVLRNSIYESHWYSLVRTGMSLPKGSLYIKGNFPSQIDRVRNLFQSASVFRAPKLFHHHHNASSNLISLLCSVACILKSFSRAITGFLDKISFEYLQDFKFQAR